MTQPRVKLTFWQTTRLIWSFARRRAAGRKAHQAALLSRKSKNSGNVSTGESLGCFATIGMIFFAAVMQAVFGQIVGTSVTTAMRVNAERDGRMAISANAYETLADAERHRPANAAPNSIGHDQIYTAAMQSYAEAPKRNPRRFVEYEEELARHYRANGLAGFVTVDTSSAAVKNLDRWPPMAFAVVGIGILFWLAMLVCQGEGLEFDVQRRRHPVWEWLLSHPVRPSAVLVAESLAPFMANPMYYTAPAFWISLLSVHSSPPFAVLTGMVIGLAFAVAASSLNKSLEAVAMLRFSVRNRGAMLGIMSWVGFAGILIPAFLVNAEAVKTAVLRACVGVFDWFPAWPVRTLLGGSADNPWLPAVAGIGFAVGLMAVSVLVTVLAMARGLDSGSSKADEAPKRGAIGAIIEKFDPIFWKELLWFRRDRGAVVQAILIPLTLAAFQAFNLRTLAASAVQYWQAFCGTAVICGTYFLLVLGPRSLASEGAALWIPLTWPRGLEELLRAKARLWEIIADCIVGMILALGVWRFPHETWKISLVAVGWLFFARGMAMRSVTLVSPLSESGEAQPPSNASRYIATIGVLSFSAGVFSQNWHVAIMGVVFTLLVSAACWQNLRARLPFLFDPWSEKLPPAPSLVHAMIAIAALVEVVGIALAMASGMGGRDALNWTAPLAYALAGFVAWQAMRHFLAGRGVADREIWNWLPTVGHSRTKCAAIGALSGALLGLLALGYIVLLWKIPAFSEWLRPVSGGDEAFSGKIKIGMFVLAVGLAPVAEEYFFRGLLYRALDREWGGARAMFGSAAYFAIYHPPISWLPVFALGVLNASLFRRTRMLLPCVCAHAVYNSVVLGLQ